MKPESLSADSNARRLSSSPEVERAAGAAADSLYRFMTSSAFFVGSFGRSSSVVPSSPGFTSEPPALSTSALKKTTRLSARLPVSCTLTPSSSAVSSSSSQVWGTGRSPRTLLRYQSSRVLLFRGAPYCFPSNCALSNGPFRTLSALPTSCSSPASNGLIQPAFANSPVQTTSMPMRSMESSRAASRRTSCSRCWSGFVGSDSATIW